MSIATNSSQKSSLSIGGAGTCVDSIAELRQLPRTGAPWAFVFGYYAATDGGGGSYHLDQADVTSPDNGGTVIVALDGGRWKLQHVGTITVKQFGAKGDGTTNDYNAIQAAIDSGLRCIYFPSGRYRVLSTLNLTNLAVTGVPLKLFGDCTQFDNGNVTAGSVILSNPGVLGWIADFTGSQFVVLEDLMFLATGPNAATFGLLYARSTAAKFAQNNSMRRVIVKLDSASGSIALANNCAEQFVCDECWLEADVPLVATLANERGFVSTYATIDNVDPIFSNTCHGYRLTTFHSLTSTSMVLTGVATAHFDTCVFIPDQHNEHKYGITLSSSAQGYKDCQNITITGQLESYTNAIRLEGNTRDLKIDLTTPSVQGAAVIALAGTVHHSPDIRTNPINASSQSVIAVEGGSTSTINGGAIIIPAGMKLVDTTLKLQGTIVDGGSVDLSSSETFSVASDSSYHPHWQFSRFYGATVWAPGALPSPVATAVTLSVPAAAVGDKVEAIWPYSSQGAILQGSVDSPGVVRLVIYNLTGATITFGAGSFKVVVERLAA